MAWHAFPSSTPIGREAVGRSLVLLLALAWGLGMVCPPTAAAEAAEAIELKGGVFLEQGGVLRVSIGFREMFDRKLRQRLRSGFTTTVVMRIYLYEKQEKKPIAFTARTLKAVYDLWDETYVLHLEEPQRSLTRRFRREDEVVDRLTSLWRFPLGTLSSLQSDTQYFVAVIAEVNPMSDELLEEVRRWLRNPYSQHHQGSGESFFGSFVSIFVNSRIRSAEKTFRLRTQPFFRRP